MKQLVMLLFLTVSMKTWAQKDLNLEQFLRQVRSENLDLKLEAAKLNAAKSKAIGWAVPPPMIGVIQLKEVAGESASGFEINQTIPFPTKLSSDSSARKYQAEAQEENQRARENEIIADAKILYFSLWSFQQKINLLNEKKEALEYHIKISRSTARSDNSASIHLIKSESDLDLLENDILSAEQGLQTEQARLAEVLNADFSKLKLLEPPISDVPVLNKAEETPQFKVAALTLESMKSRESEAKSSWLPDFNFRYKEMGPTSMAGKNNEFMIGISLPFIFPWEPYSASKAASSERIQAEFEVEKQKRRFEAEKQILLTRAESLKKQINNLKEKILPRAEKRMKLVHNLAPRDIESLQTHREAVEAFPELKMKLLDLRLEFEMAVASLEKYRSNKGQSHE